jgi:hypothetical protein
MLNNRAYSFVRTFPNFMSSNFSAEEMSPERKRHTTFKEFVDAKLQQKESMIKSLVILVLDLAIFETRELKYRCYWLLLL